MFIDLHQISHSNEVEGQAVVAGTADRPIWSTFEPIGGGQREAKSRTAERRFVVCADAAAMRFDD